MDYEKIQKEFGMELYRDMNRAQNPYIVYYTETFEFFEKLNKTSVMDYFKNKNPRLFYKHFYNSKVTNQISDTQIKETLILQQNVIFQNFVVFFEMIKQNIKGITSHPTNDRIVNEKLNVYKPNLNFHNLKPDIKSKNKFPHLDIIFRNVFQEGYPRIYEFLSWKVRNPTQQVPINWAVIDSGGTGKSLLYKYIYEPIFRSPSIQQKNLSNQFNKWAMESPLVVVEECKGYESDSQLKYYTGQDTIAIEQKGKDIIYVKNYLNLICHSNNIKSIKIDKNDRRFNFVGGGKKLSATQSIPWISTLFGSKEENEKFFKTFHENIEQEQKEFYKYLLAMEIDRLKIQVPLDTELKKTTALMFQSHEEEFLDTIAENENFYEFLNELFDGDTKKVQVYLNQCERKIIDDKEIWVMPIKSLFELYQHFSIDIPSKFRFSKKNLIQQLKSYENYFKVFGKEIYQHKFDGVNKKCIELKTHIDENQTISL